MKIFIKLLILLTFEWYSSADILLSFEDPSRDFTLASLEEALLFIENSTLKKNSGVKISWRGEQHISNSWSIIGNVSLISTDTDSMAIINILLESSLAIDGALTIKNMKLFFSNFNTAHDIFFFFVRPRP